MTIRSLIAADLEIFRTLRREALADSPRAFAESVSDHDSTTPEVSSSRFAALNDNNFIVGAFDDSGKLIGSVGLARLTQEKTRHKAIVWGVYLKPQFRGSGAARE
ncbi:MAG TPA: GNAT family N-acetyltransferase, partial [Bryobacteraceae bacterium]|nr:GNAT family N-acetyltransferase [Bryobacteraceae bacterium]